MQKWRDGKNLYASSKLVHTPRPCLNVLDHARPCWSMLVPCLNRFVHQLTLPWTSPHPTSLDPSVADTLFFFIDLSLGAILLEIVLLGLRSPRPPLWGAGKSFKPRLFPSFRIALPSGPEFCPAVRPPLTPIPLSLTLPCSYRRTRWTSKGIGLRGVKKGYEWLRADAAKSCLSLF